MNINKLGALSDYTVAFAKAGLMRPDIPAIARAAGVSEGVVRNAISGRPVSQEAMGMILGAIGAEDTGGEAEVQRVLPERPHPALRKAVAEATQKQAKARGMRPTAAREEPALEEDDSDLSEEFEDLTEDRPDPTDSLAAALGAEEVGLDEFDEPTPVPLSVRQRQAGIPPNPERLVARARGEG